MVWDIALTLFGFLSRCFWHICLLAASTGPLGHLPFGGLWTFCSCGQYYWCVPLGIYPLGCHQSRVLPLGMWYHKTTVLGDNDSGRARAFFWWFLCHFWSWSFVTARVICVLLCCIVFWGMFPLPLAIYLCFGIDLWLDSILCVIAYGQLFIAFVTPMIWGIIVYSTLECWLSLWRVYYWLMIMWSSIILCGLHRSSLWRSTLSPMLPHYYISVYLTDYLASLTRVFYARVRPSCFRLGLWT